MTTVVGPTTVTITHDGTTQTVELLGVEVRESGIMHKRALQTTQAQLQ